MPRRPTPTQADAEPADVRGRILATAARLLAEGGREGFTTRSVTSAAGVQQPTLYRLFGDKTGLLEAVAERGLATYVAEKAAVIPNPEPLDDFREGWNRHVDFGLAHPALFSIIWGDPDPTRESPAAKAGQAALRLKVRSLAAAGLLRVSEERAVRLTHAACTGAVLTLLDMPKGERDPELAADAREAVMTAITHAHPVANPYGPSGAAIALRATLDQTAALTPGERHLLDELLHRIIGEHARDR